ncbi:unnamed protein product, partial [Adineta ricciae]
EVGQKGPALTFISTPAPAFRGLRAAARPAPQSRRWGQSVSK